MVINERYLNINNFNFLSNRLIVNLVRRLGFKNLSIKDQKASTVEEHALHNFSREQTVV